MLCEHEIRAYVLKNKFHQVEELRVENLSVDYKLDVVFVYLFCKPIWDVPWCISIFNEKF